MKETGKERSQRIELDHYRRRDGLARWRRLWIVGSLVAVSIFVAFALMDSNAESQLSTGELSATHAHLEQNCRKCHDEFHPINPQSSEQASQIFDLVALPSEQDIAEDKCSTCHHVGDHHRGKMSLEYQAVDQNCAGCHREHLGRDQDLTAIANRTCVECHGNLEVVYSNLENGRTADASLRTIHPTVSAFAHADQDPPHPNFGFKTSDTGDPGRVKFDHAQHMMPGQVDEGDRGGTLHANLDATPNGTDSVSNNGSGLVQLDCLDCHEFAGDPDDVSFPGDAELGRHLKPINFEDHCQACHAISPGGNSPDSLWLLHAAPWPKIRLLIEADLKGSRATGEARSPNDDSQRTPQTGEGTGPEPTADTADNQPEEIGKIEIAGGMNRVWHSCKKCHDRAEFNRPESSAESILRDPANTQPMIPARWLKHGIYDHGAHREIECRYCHRQAYPSTPPVKQDANDHNVVMISGIESCVECHQSDAAAASKDSTTNKLFGNMLNHSSDNCVLCHRYHSATSETHQ